MFFLDPDSHEKLLDRLYAFTRSDHAEILSCLTDDVEWVVPGIFHLTGKATFDKERENCINALVVGSYRAIRGYSATAKEVVALRIWRRFSHRNEREVILVQHWLHYF